MSEITTLAEYATIQGGYAYKSTDFLKTGKFKVLKIKNIRFGYIDYSETDFISDQLSKKTEEWKTKPKDILISMTGSGPNAPASLVGRVARVGENEPISFINQRIGRVIVNEKVDSDYIYYLLSQKSSQEYFVNNSTGSANQVNINGNTILSLEVPCISFEESKKIAQILNAFDDKIQLNTQINQTLEQIAQALFKSWFVDFDPVRAKVQALSDGLSLEQAELAAMQAISGKTPEKLTVLSQTQPDRYAELAETAKAFPCEMVEVDGVEVPKGWAIKPFGSLLENTIGGDWGKEEEDEKHTENVFVFRGTDLPNIQTNEFEAIPKRYIAKNKLKSRKAKYGDIIIEVSGGSKNQPTGRSLLITKNLLCNFDLPVIPASFCRLFTPINEKIAVLLACHLKMIYTQGKTWEYQLQSTGISNFQTKNFLENELIVIPDENIFNTFYEKVGVIFEKMTSNENMLLSKTRDLLLPRLLNGDFCAHV